MVGSSRGDSNYESMELRGPHSQYVEVKLEANPAYANILKLTSSNEPVYSECGPDVTNSGDVRMEENPAYQSVDAA